MSHLDSLDSVYVKDEVRCMFDEGKLGAYVVVVLSSSGKVFFPFCLVESTLRGREV